MDIKIDLFSDTVTRPTAAMKQAMMAAPVGDEQTGSDPTTYKLEAMMAELLGKEAAMFFPSATMANEIAICLLCERGDELLAAENCHLFFAETGGPAIHAGVMARPIPTTTGIFSGEELQSTYRHAKGPHYPRSRLVNIENTTNMGGGYAWDLANLREVTKTAQELELKVHVDGSRLFNASVKTGVAPRALTAGADTVTICLSKGLGCPVGAVLAFKEEHRQKVRRLKQLFGGAMRQSGILAAAGIYALEHHIDRLAEDHANATLLAHLISERVPNVKVENLEPSTNMVFFVWLGDNGRAEQFNEHCLANGLRLCYLGAGRFRTVTHLDVNRGDIEEAVTIIQEACRLAQ